MGDLLQARPGGAREGGGRTKLWQGRATGGRNSSPRTVMSQSATVPIHFYFHDTTVLLFVCLSLGARDEVSGRALAAQNEVLAGAGQARIGLDKDLDKDKDLV